MSADPLPNHHIVSLKGYVPGEQPQGGGWIKLNTNENPYPPSPRVVEAIKKHLDTDGAALRLYPSPDSAPLRKAVAELHGYSVDQIVAGNGSDDILNLLVRAYADANRPIGMLDPSYSLYPVIAAIQGAAVVKIPMSHDFSLDVAAIANSRTSIFFLTNPNAPLGISFSAKMVEELAQAFSGILVVDEAYADFAESSALPLVQEFDNVIVLRTLSKGYSLAGFRVGVGVANPSLLSGLFKVKDSYNIDAVAIAVGTAAMRDQDYKNANAEKVKISRTKLTNDLKNIGFVVLESHGNFVLATPSQGNAEEIYLKLKESGILVRYFNQAGLADKLRITVGTDEQNQALIDFLSTL